MELPLYQIDAFTENIFGGNPACVVPLEEEWPADSLLLQIAQENAVAETAFFIDKGEFFHLRWFTPETEMDLCGHATLAAAHAIIDILNYRKEKIVFQTRSGELLVTVQNSRYTLDLPSRKPQLAALPDLLAKSLNKQPQEILKARDFVLVYPKQEDVLNISINRIFFDQLELGTGGVIVTAKSTDYDFISRFFTPGASVFEDPVTGSAHCSLVPYWSELLGKEKMNARQASGRGGILFCENKGSRVYISGYARTYAFGKCFTS